MRTTPTIVCLATLAAAASCSTPRAVSKPAAGQPRAVGTTYTIRDTTIATTFDAAGVAEPLRQATLSTKLMGTVTDVLVREGDAVAAGQTLIRIDASELEARQARNAAALADATAMQRDAEAQARRIRALYADSAATRAQLDAVETAVARADAAVRAARAADAELEAITSYATVRAPFAGTVSKRFVDPGAFAAPGAPLVTVIDGKSLRIAATATPDVAARLGRGARIAALIEGREVAASVEGVVPAAAGNVYTINAIVPNASGTVLPGSSATLRVPLGTRPAVVIPASALVREGDLTGVRVRQTSGDEVRWVRIGTRAGAGVEVLGGLRAGDQIVVASVPSNVARVR